MESILIVQISDLHIKNDASPAVGRLESLAGAIGSMRSEAEHVVVVMTGDIAFSGKQNQYSIAIDALSKLETKLLDDWAFRSVHMYAAPGNHDVDFDTLKPAVRDALLGGLNADESGQLAVIETLASSQKAFFNFMDAVSPNTRGINPLLNLATIGVGGKSINLLILNTSWSSRLDEVPGALRMPADVLQPVVISDDLSIALLHHPLNWYSPQDGKALSDWLDLHADVALWGHEHRSDAFQVSRKKFGSTILNFLAMPLDDELVSCGFRAIILHSDNNCDVRTFEWHGRFPVNTDSYVRSISKNPARELGRVRYTREFKLFLQDVGANFKHPRLDRSLVLSDILIEPAFRNYTSSPEDPERLDFALGFNEIRSEMESYSDVVVYGPEQAGKTTFAKFLIEDSKHLGLTPIYLDASLLKSSNRGEVTGWINSSYSRQYESDCLDAVRQLEPGKCLLIVDNAHQLPGSAKHVGEIILRLQRLASKRVFLTSQNPSVTILAAGKSSGEDIRLWSEAKWFEILPLNHKRRGELIRIWATIGRDDYAYSDAVEADVRQIKEMLDQMLGKRFMPKYPIFLLILLQQLEAGRNINTVVRNGSHGHIFEALIVSSFEGELRSHDIGVTQDFLSAFAFRLWASRESSVSLSGFGELIGDFKREKYVDLSHPRLLKELVAAKVLSDDGALVSFRYSYFYYYYLARWLSGARNHDAAESMMDSFVETIHSEMSANVVMFVAHLGDHNWVIEKLLSLSDSLFAQASECRLEDRAVLAAKYLDESKAVELLTGDAPDVSDVHHAQQDELDTDRNEQLEDIFKFNTAAKLIQTLGQILRSKSGGIDSSEKVKIVKSTNSLARRLMETLYGIAETSAEAIIESASEIFETEIKLNSKEARHLAGQLVAAVVGGIARHLVSRAADAFATRDLMPLIDRLAETAEQDDDQDDILIVLVARIMADSNYPQERVDGFLRKIKPADVLSHSALAYAVARSFYLQPPPRAIRDSACAKLGIRVRNVRALIERPQKLI